MPIRYAVVLLTSLAVATIGSSTRAQTVTPLPTGRPMTFELAGVKLGATPAEAKAALVRSGYRINVGHPVLTFEQDVANAVANRLDKPAPSQTPAGLSGIGGYGPHRESVTVVFMQRVGGPIVASIIVTVPTDAMKAVDVRAQLVAKYGRPDSSRFQGAELAWCAAEAVNICGTSILASGHLDTDYPRLRAETYADGQIVLNIGDRAYAQNKKDRADAIERLAPKSRTGAF